MSLADSPVHEANGAARHDHDRARYALQQGEVRPIAEILRRVADEVPGEVIEVELEREKWLGMVEVLVDAATAEILAVEED